MGYTQIRNWASFAVPLWVSVWTRKDMEMVFKFLLLHCKGPGWKSSYCHVWPLQSKSSSLLEWKAKKERDKNSGCVGQGKKQRNWQKANWGDLRFIFNFFLRKLSRLKWALCNYFFLLTYIITSFNNCTKFHNKNIFAKKFDVINNKEGLNVIVNIWETTRFSIITYLIHARY